MLMLNILNPIGWYEKRKRAIKLGSTHFARVWFDPVSGDVWYSGHRFPILGKELKTERDVVEVSRQLNKLNVCKCEVTPKDLKLGRY